MGSWEALRKQARQMEAEIEKELVECQGLLSRHSTATSPTSVLDTSEHHLDTLLAKFGEIVEQMAQVLETQYPPSQTTTNPAMIHVLQQHRDHLYEYSRERDKMKTTLNQLRQRHELLMGGSSTGQQFSSDRDRLLDERRRADKMHSQTDNIIDVALGTFTRVRDQGANVNFSRNRLQNATMNLPTLNSIIGKISARKRRDNLILGGVISVCIILIFMYTQRGS